MKTLSQAESKRITRAIAGVVAVWRAAVDRASGGEDTIRGVDHSNRIRSPRYQTRKGEI
jgi:hypothetical protein